jgi:outer membrane receptor protein involved in Fe transport
MVIGSSAGLPSQPTALNAGHSTKVRGRVALCGLLVTVSPTLLAADEAASTAPADAERLQVAAAPSQQNTGGILATVVVEARNRLEPLKDVPQAISVISGEDLEREQIVTLDGITKRMANVKWNYGNSQTSNYSIRGVGKIGNNHAADPSVGITVDEVAYGYNPLGSFNFYDVDTVEVARGPQGTLYGRNATLGAIRVRTKRPSFTQSVDYTLGFNKYEAQDYGKSNGNFTATAALGGPVIDDLLAYRAAFNVDKGGGYLLNEYNPDNSYINSDRASGRLQLLLTPSEDFSALLRVDVHPRNQEYANVGSTNFFNTPTPLTYADGTPNPLTNDASVKLGRRWFLQNGDYSYLDNYLSEEYINSDSQQGLVTGTNGASLELNWDLGNDRSLTSISGFKDYYFNAFRDDEGTVFDILTAAGSHIRYQQISQEIRFSAYDGGLVDYQAGVYALSAKNLVSSNNIHGGDSGAWNASNSQYATLDADSNGRYLMENALNGLWKNGGHQDIENKSAAIFGQAEWHLTDALTLSTGARLTWEDRRNTVSSYLVQQGYGSELNPVAVNGVQLGGFATNGSGALVAGANSAEQLALADSVAQEYFNVASYGALTPQQRSQVAAAKAIRASQIGVVWNPVEAEAYDDVQPTWVVSQSYKLSSDVTTYLSFQHGEKAGIPQVINGVSATTRPEKNDVYEWGVKSTLFNRTLDVNFAIFHSTIKDYQQAVRAFDEYTTSLRNDGLLYYTNATGNVPEVEVKGVEIDGVYAGIPNTTLHFAGAYNDAKYKKFTNSAQPPENGNLSDPFRDVSGWTLPGAAKFTFDVGIEYRVPVLDDRELNTSLNTFYTSKFNSDNSLSSYGGIPAHSITDFSIGLARDDGKFDVSLVVKNLFDDDTRRQQVWNAYAPAIPRWYGIGITGSL